jgi:hypothetical protein
MAANPAFRRFMTPRLFQRPVTLCLYVGIQAFSSFLFKAV